MKKMKEELEMRKWLFLSILMMTGVMFMQVPPAHAQSKYNFGDYRSVTLVGKAWKALGEGDLDDVLAYTNKTAELYAGEAKDMQASLSAYPEGNNDKIFSYWALNDVGTAYFIQGEAYRKAGMKDEAKAAYQKVVDEFSYAQTWDPGGWFWKPAEAAKTKISMIESGSNIDFGNNSSETLVQKAWQALADKDLKSVETYCGKAEESYGDKAKEMQSSLTEYPWESKEKIFEYWALNDVGTCLFIEGEAYRKAGMDDKAKEAYQKVIDDYSFAQTWDPAGWFWKPAEAAQEKLVGMAVQE